MKKLLSSNKIIISLLILATAAPPFIDNIEGFVYFKNKYLQKKAFLKFQLEMIIYSLLFSFLLALLFLIFK